MKTEVCVFEGNQVSVSLFKNNSSENVMINATEMAKIFGKQVGHFLENENTQLFIQECLTNNRISDYLNIKSEEDLIVSKQRTGTWMHRALALKFAAWLSPKFEVWVYSTIEDLLFGKLLKRDRSFEKTFELQREAEYLKIKLDKTGDDFTRYLEIQRQLKYETAYRRSLTIEESNGMKSLFNE
jgi:hypothetical protein